MRGEEELQGSVRQRFDRMQSQRMGTHNYGLIDNNNNNLDDEDSDDEGAPEAHTISTTLLRKSEQDALEGRLQLMHVPRVGRISRP